MNEAAQSIATGQQRVLIADDEADIRNLIGRYFNAHGFDVDTAQDGYEALRKITRNTPDALLLDISMPEMGGIPLLQFVNDMNVRIAVVFAISGVASESDVAEMSNWGADEFFAKPLDLKILESRVRLRLADVQTGAAERRGSVRVEVSLKNLQVNVGVLGFEPTTGVVLDVSYGGLKVALSREISKLLIGEDCIVRFVDSQDRVSPEATLGKLRRMEADGQYGIEFDKPLEVLRVANGEQGSES